MSDALFHVDAAPAPVDPAAGLSADRRRTLRQTEVMSRGYHPLALALNIGAAHLALHGEAAPHDDRDAPGRRCGNCRFRRNLPHHNIAHPKCVFGSHDAGAPRASHGAGTDVRAWWPACRDHEVGDAALPDAMRWVPDPKEMR